MTEKSLICFICLCLFKTQGSHAIRGQSTVLDDFDEVYVDRVQSDPSDKEFDDYESDFEDETLSIERVRTCKFVLRSQLRLYFFYRPIKIQDQNLIQLKR